MPNSNQPDKRNDAGGTQREQEALLRREIRQELEQREQRMRQDALQHEEDARREMEDRVRTRLKEEEEEKFFLSRGYTRHVNRYGHAEWITPEEARLRKEHRSKEFRHRMFRGGRNTRSRLGKWVLASMLLLAILVTGILALKAGSRTASGSGSIVVQTDMPDGGGQGAVAVYVDGELKTRSALTRVVIPELSEGPHSIVLHREGFQCQPPVKRIVVKPKAAVLASFRMTGVPLMGRLGVTANLKSEFDLYVDGLPVPFSPTQPLRIPVGYHVVCAVKPGYVATPQWHRVFVTATETVTVDFNFQTAAGKTGVLEVTSGGEEPAYVYVDGAFTGLKTDGATIVLPVGQHGIETPAAAPVRQEIRTVADSGDSIEFSQPAGGERPLLPFTIAAKNPGAAIVVDGQWTGHIAPWSTKLPAGRHYVNLFRAGQWSSAADQAVMVDKDAPETVSIDF